MMKAVTVIVLIAFAAVAAIPAPAEAWVGEVATLVGLIFGPFLAALGIKKATEKPAAEKKSGESQPAVAAPAVPAEKPVPPAVAVPSEAILAR